MARLVISPNANPKAFPLAQGAIIIGSADGCDLKLTQPGVVTTHARVLFKNGKYFLEDLSGKSVGLNDAITDYERLTDGDVIKLGEVELLFDEHDNRVLGAASDEGDPDEATDQGEYHEDSDSAKPAAGPVRREWGLLVVLRHGQTQEKVSLTNENIIIGRDPKCEVVLKEAAISGRHTRMHLKGKQVLLEDLASKNGTYLNGERITQPEIIRHLDKFSVGSFTLIFESRSKEDGDGNEGTDPEAGEATGAFTESTGGGETLPKLIVCSEKWYGKEYQLKEGETIIGRESDCEVALLDDSVSRRHASLHQEDGTYLVIDLDSANGVLVNGYKVTQKSLHHGDRIQLGNIRLFFAEPGKVYRLPKADEVDEIPTEKPKQNPLVAVLAALVLFSAIGMGAWVFLNRNQNQNPELVNLSGGGTQFKVDRRPIKLRELTEAKDLQNWEACIEAATTFLQEFPDDPEGEFFLDKCKAELLNNANYTRGLRELGTQGFDAAMEAFKLLPADSTYHAAAQAKLEEARTTAANVYLAEAERLLNEEKKCEEAITYFGYALTYLPADKGLIEKKLRAEEKCNKPVVVHVGGPVAPDKKKLASSSFQTATSAYASGDYQAALDAIDEVVRYGLGDKEENTRKALALRPHVRAVKAALDEAASSGSEEARYRAYHKAILADRKSGISGAPVKSHVGETAGYFGRQASQQFGSGNTAQAYRSAATALEIDSGNSDASTVKKTMDKTISDRMIQIRLAENDPPRQNDLVNQLLSYAPPEHPDFKKAKKILDDNIKLRGGDN